MILSLHPDNPQARHLERIAELEEQNDAQGRLIETMRAPIRIAELEKKEAGI